MANRIQLPNGCSMSTPSVNPKNWKTGGKSLIKKNWQIQYYFYDQDIQPKGKLVVVKGMNDYKDLKERIAVTKVLIQDEIDENLKGYNHFLNKYVIDEDLTDRELHPDLPFIAAFKLALDKISCTSKHKKEIKWTIERLEKKAIKFGLTNTTISQLKRSELKKLLEACKYPDYYFNKVKGYISTLFGELIEYECCEINLTRDIRKRKVVVKQRETLSPEEFKLVMDHLHCKTYEFWRYAKIFLFSGSRSTELFALQAKDVNIDSQEFKVTIKKGKLHKEVIKVILKEVIPLWRELLKGAKPNDFIFSKGLIPGKTPIKAYQITNRWKRHVKDSDQIKDSSDKVVKITADFYALKHSMLDSLPTEEAQLIASHTNSKTTSIYQVNQAKRNREKLKSVEVSAQFI